MLLIGIDAILTIKPTIPITITPNKIIFVVSKYAFFEGLFARLKS
jgi:hypothetical protein